MKRWCCAILLVVMLAQALPVSALAAAVTAKPITEKELAAAYALAGLNDGAGAYHSGMKLKASMNARQLSDWLDEQLDGTLTSVGKTLSRVHAVLAELKKDDRAAWRALTQEGDGPALMERCAALQLEAENLRQDMRFLQDRLEENIAMVDQMSSLLDSRLNYDYEEVRYSVRIRAAVDAIMAMREEILEESAQWQEKIEGWQSIVSGDYRGNSALDGAMGNWISRVFAAGGKQVSAETKVTFSNAATRASRLQANGGVLANPAVSSTTVKVLGKDQLGFLFYKKEEGTKNVGIENVVIRLRDADKPDQTPVEVTTGKDGAATVQINAFTVDEYDYVNLYMEVDASKTGYRDLCKPTMEMLKGTIHTVYLEKDDQTPYVYRGTFDGHDFLYEEYQFLYSPANEADFDIVLETRHGDKAPTPVMCTADDLHNVKIYKPTSTQGNVYTFHDKWKKELNPDVVKDLYFQWGEVSTTDNRIDATLTPVKSVFDQPTDLSSTLGVLDAGFGFSIKIPGIDRTLDVGLNVLKFPVKASVDPMGNAVITVGKSSEKLGKLDPNWQNRDMDYWNKLTKGVEKDMAHYLENRADLKAEQKAMKFPVMKSFNATFGLFAIFSVAWQKVEGVWQYDGKASVGGSVSFSFDEIQYSTLGPFPVYADFNLTISAALAFGLAEVQVQTDGKTGKILSVNFVPVPNVSFQLTLAISLTLGAGIKGLVSIWVKGSASITFMGAWLTSGFDFKINAAAGISGGLTVFIVEVSMDILSGEWELYPNNNSYSLLEHYMPRANDGDAKQAGGSDEPETYPKLAPELSAELSGMEDATGDFRILMLGNDIFAFLIRDGRVHWHNLTQNIDGSIADVLAECQSRYDGGIDVAGMRDYAFDVSIGSGTVDAQGTSKEFYPDPNDFFVLACMCAGAFDENGLPEAGQGTCLYTMFLWPNADGRLVLGFNGIDDHQLGYFRSAWMGGGANPVTDYRGVEPRVLTANYHAAVERTGWMDWQRRYDHKVVVEVKELQSADSGATQHIGAVQQDADFTCPDDDGSIVPTPAKKDQIANIELSDSLQADDIASGAGDGYARVFTQYIAQNTWVAVSRSDGGAGGDGAIELYDDPSMNGSKKSVALATGDVNRFAVLPAASDEDPTLLFYADNLNTDEEARHYMLKGLRIDPAQRGDDGSLQFSAVETAYDVNLPTDKVKVRKGDIDLIYWLSTGPKSADGKDLYRIHFATYDPATNTLADDSVFAEFSLPDGDMAVRELYLTDKGTWYFTAAGVPKADKEPHGDLKPLSLYSFSTQMAPVLDLKNQVVADLLVCPGDFDDFTVSVMNSGNLAATAFDVDMVLLDGSKDGVPLERLHADLQAPENSSLSTLNGGQATAITTGEKAFYRLEDYEFTARQRDFVISEQKTNYVVENGALKSKDSEDVKSDYVKSNLMMPGAKAVFKGSIRIPDDWSGEKESDKEIELRLYSAASNFNWVGAMAKASGRHADVVANAAFDDITWTRDAATGEMIPSPQGVQGTNDMLLAKVVSDPQPQDISSLHDLEVHHRVYRGPNNEKMLNITVTDLANTGESFKLTGALYLDDSQEPMHFGMEHFSDAISDATTHNFDMPLAALVDPNACQKARVVIKGVGVEECAFSNNEFTLYLNGAPSALAILRQPRDATVQEGASASFDVQVTGGETPYGYQWQMWDAKHKKWVDIPGATDSTLARRKVEKKWNGAQFRCVITDHTGKSIASEAATLTVRGSVDTGDPTSLPLYLAVAALALALLWWVRRRTRRT